MKRRRALTRGFLANWPRVLTANISGEDRFCSSRVSCSSGTSAVSYWLGVGRTTIAKWRKALGVTKKNNEGTMALVRTATSKALEAALEQGVTGEERERRSRLA